MQLFDVRGCRLLIDWCNPEHAIKLWMICLYVSHCHEKDLISTQVSLRWSCKTDFIVSKKSSFRVMRTKSSCLERFMIKISWRGQAFVIVVGRAIFAVFGCDTHIVSHCKRNEIALHVALWRFTNDHWSSEFSIFYGNHVHRLRIILVESDWQSDGSGLDMT